MLLQIFVITNMSNIQPFFGTELGEPSDVYCRNIVLDGTGVGTVFARPRSILLRNGANASVNVFTTSFTDFVVSPTTTGGGTGMELTISMEPFYVENANIVQSNSANISITITNAGSGYVAGDTISVSEALLRSTLGDSGQGVLPEPFLSADLSGSIFSGAGDLDLKIGNNLDFVENELPPTVNGGGRADVNRGETGWQFSVGVGLQGGRDATINLIIPPKSDTSSNQIDYTSDTYDVVVSITGTTNLSNISDSGSCTRTAICPKADGSTWITILRDTQSTLSPGFMTVRLVKRKLAVQ